MGCAIATHWNNADSLAVPSSEFEAEKIGTAFLQYRNAVATFQRQNPTFTGSVPAQSLIALGFHFPEDFLHLAGNAISATGASGRIVTSYAKLSGGAASIAQHASQGDASLGVASGPNWTSYHAGAVTPLLATVPDGAVVSVIQIGN